MIESAIFYRYQQLATTNEPNLDLLFNVISNFIKEKRWVYEGSERDQNIWSLPEQNDLIVNCFHLTDFFVHMAKKIGVKPHKCYRIELCYFVSKQNEHVLGDYRSFSSTLPCNEYGLYEFDIHCIVMANGFCFDLALQAKYPLINDGVDIYSSLCIAMDKNDFEAFKRLLPDLLNVNEQCITTGWTLMHIALDAKKYAFVKLLLENGAADNIIDNNNLTALDILNTQIYDPSTSLDDLRQAHEYLTLKMKLLIQNKMNQLEIENRAATIIQSFWIGRRNTSNPSILPLLSPSAQ